MGLADFGVLHGPLGCFCCTFFSKSFWNNISYKGKYWQYKKTLLVNMVDEVSVHWLVSLDACTDVLDLCNDRHILGICYIFICEVVLKWFFLFLTKSLVL